MILIDVDVLVGPIYLLLLFVVSCHTLMSSMCLLLFVLSHVLVVFVVGVVSYI